MRVAVLGAGGNMGLTTCRALLEDERFELVAAIDPRHTGQPLSSLVGSNGDGITISDSIDEVATTHAEAIVDFTVAAAAIEHLTWCAENGVHAVCGTTGIEDQAVATLRDLFSVDGSPNCVLAPNFAISAVLLLHLCAVVAPYFDSIEVVELHHERKRDAPSGTSIATAHVIANARSEAKSVPLEPSFASEEVFEGARGAVGPGGVHVHSIRLTGLVAHEEVIFGTKGQSLTIRQDSYDRSSFIPGILLALEKVSTRPGFTVGLEQLLDL